ncbi:hypothetical protein VNO77_34385 [Canavalia gladiata]|uniref:Uncharacterized protein n=1 Tax=Canavalia gladiata TaxID=3824 RepID=A0AAN9KE74_CANGL
MHGLGTCSQPHVYNVSPLVNAMLQDVLEVPSCSCCPTNPYLSICRQFHLACWHHGISVSGNQRTKGDKDEWWLMFSLWPTKTSSVQKPGSGCIRPNYEYKRILTLTFMLSLNPFQVKWRDQGNRDIGDFDSCRRLQPTHNVTHEEQSQPCSVLKSYVMFPELLIHLHSLARFVVPRWLSRISATNSEHILHAQGLYLDPYKSYLVIHDSHSSSFVSRLCPLYGNDHGETWWRIIFKVIGWDRGSLELIFRDVTMTPRICAYVPTRGILIYDFGERQERLVLLITIPANSFLHSVLGPEWHSGYTKDI